MFSFQTVIWYIVDPEHTSFLCGNKRTVSPLTYPSALQNSGIEKAFLFDVVSKIYIATDSSPVDMQTYELCCDMIDVVIDISCIYGWVAFIVETLLTS